MELSTPVRNLSSQQMSSRVTSILLDIQEKELADPTKFTEHYANLSCVIANAASTIDPDIKALDPNSNLKKRRLKESHLDRAVLEVGCMELKRMFPEYEDFIDSEREDIIESRGLELRKKYRKRIRRLCRDAVQENMEARSYDYDALETFTMKNEELPHVFNRYFKVPKPTGFALDEHGNAIITDDPRSFRVEDNIGQLHGRKKPMFIDSVEDFLLDDTNFPEFGNYEPMVSSDGKITTKHDEFVEQVNEFLTEQANLTPYKKVKASYWADGPGTVTPPGHGIKMVQDVAFRDGENHTLQRDILLNSALSTGLYDTGLAIWYNKEYWEHQGMGGRPVTTIRNMFPDDDIVAWAGPNRGNQIIKGSEYLPYQAETFVTPAFASNPSGHSGFTEVTTTIAANFFGNDEYYTGEGLAVRDHNGDGKLDIIGEYQTTDLGYEDNPTGELITMRWPTLTDASEAAGTSRYSGGIHWRFEHEGGQSIGETIGQMVSDAMF